MICSFLNVQQHGRFAATSRQTRNVAGSAVSWCPDICLTSLTPASLVLALTQLARARVQPERLKLKLTAWSGPLMLGSTLPDSLHDLAPVQLEVEMRVDYGSRQHHDLFSLLSSICPRRIRALVVPFEDANAHLLSRFHSLQRLRLVDRGVYARRHSLARWALAHLQSLDLHDASIDCADLQALQDLVQLTQLDLSQTHVGDRGLQYLAKLPLTELTLHPSVFGMARITRLDSLAAMPLTSLKLRRCHVDSAALECMSRTPLRALQIRACARWSTIDPLARICRQWPQLSSLEIDVRVRDDDLHRHVSQLMQLERLQLWYAGGVTPVGVASLQQLPRLTDLDWALESSQMSHRITRPLFAAMAGMRSLRRVAITPSFDHEPLHCVACTRQAACCSASRIGKAMRNTLARKAGVDALSRLPHLQRLHVSYKVDAAMLERLGNVLQL